MSRRVDQAHVFCSVTWRGDRRDLGTFNGKTGGNVTADNTKIRRGNMGRQRSLGGPSTVEDITITRDYDLARDHNDAHWIMAGVGRATFECHEYLLDDDDQPFGRPFVWTGKVVGYEFPEHDADSADATSFGLVLSPDGDVG